MDIKQTPAAIEYQKEVTNEMSKLLALCKEKEKAKKKHEEKRAMFNTNLEDMPGEIWKDIENFEGLYQISNKGRVKSLVNNIIMIPNISNRGYYRIDLRKKGKTTRYSLHRLVAKAFIPIPQELLDQGYTYDTLQVNHLDENKLNNHYTNLEWCTPQYNSEYSNSKIISQFDLNGNFIQKFTNIKKVARDLNIPSEDITRVCKGILNTSGGYLWRYWLPEHIEGYALPDINSILFGQGRSKAVSQFDKDGNFLKAYISAEEAAKQTGAFANTIRAAILPSCSYQNSAGGFIWKEYNPNLHVLGYQLPKEEIPNVGLNNKDKAKQLDIYDLKTKELVKRCKSFQEASEFLKTSRSNIRKLLKKDCIYQHYWLKFIPKNQ